MKPVAVVAVAAESALGSGARAYSVGNVGDAPGSAIAADDELARAGLSKPFVARARRAATGDDPAASLLDRVTRSLVAELDRAVPRWRDLRVGVVVGTSSGGMDPLTRALGLRARGEPISSALARGAPYFGPLAALDAALDVSPVERVQVLAACASSGFAMGLAARWLEADLVDLVVAGGYDAVTAFVAAGFESLGATSATLPAPFRLGRDGMALGEGAALVALAGRDIATTHVVGYVRGFGASSDAVHVTAPDRTGAGVVRAANAALRDAGATPDSVDLVSAHATATPFNDAAEAKALAAVLGERAATVPVHPFKAVIGHTLGASAALEALAALDAMHRGVLPAAVGAGAVDPDARVRLLERNAPGDAKCALKLSAAFGGANVSLVVGTEPGHGPPLHQSGVTVVAVGEPKVASDVLALAEQVRIPAAQLARLDALSAAAVAAASSAVERAPPLPLERTGVVVGTVAATLENNEAFDRRLRERGARGVEPRRFPATSPNLPAGQCSIAFGLLGPSLSVGAGPDAAIEALLVAFDLLEAGDADAMVVVAAEHSGDVVRDLFVAARSEPPTDGAMAAVLRRAPGGFARGRLAAFRRHLGHVEGNGSGAAVGWPLLAAALEELGR